MKSLLSKTVVALLMSFTLVACERVGPSQIDGNGHITRVNGEIYPDPAFVIRLDVESRIAVDLGRMNSEWRVYDLQIVEDRTGIYSGFVTFTKGFDYVSSPVDIYLRSDDSYSYSFIDPARIV